MFMFFIFIFFFAFKSFYVDLTVRYKKKKNIQPTTSKSTPPSLARGQLPPSHRPF